MATNYSINYEDDRFKQVEQAKNEAINNSNSMYDQMINDSSQYYQNQINAVNDYSNTQQQLQQERTDQAINEINQQKEYAEKDYQKEQRGAYTDWQKESNRYGVNAEQQAASGLANTGYSESSQVSMYNTYQSRVATARESYQRAVVDYDNAIANARISNNAALAEIAYNALQNTLELSLQGFQYKNQLLQTRLNAQQQLDSEYYQRYQNVLSQMNTENALKEQVRQYNETLAFQKAQAKQEQKNWEKEYALSLKASKSSGRSGGGGSGGKSPKITKTAPVVKTEKPINNADTTPKDAKTYGTFSNGYQPKGISGYGKVSKNNTSIQVINSKTKKTSVQNVWKTKDGTLWYWNGNSRQYEKLKGTVTKVTI